MICSRASPFCASSFHRFVSAMTTRGSSPIISSERRRGCTIFRGVSSVSTPLPCSATHQWPGNIRELKHVIDRAQASATGSLINPKILLINQRRAGASVVRGATTFGEIRVPTDGKRLRDIEREALELTLQLTDYNQSAAARILCISRPTLCEKAQSVRSRKAESIEVCAA